MDDDVWWGEIKDNSGKPQQVGHKSTSGSALGTKLKIEGLCFPFVAFSLQAVLVSSGRWFRPHLAGTALGLDCWPELDELERRRLPDQTEWANSKTTPDWENFSNFLSNKAPASSQPDNHCA